MRLPCLCIRVVVPLQGDNSHPISRQMSPYRMTFVTAQSDHLCLKRQKPVKVQN